MIRDLKDTKKSSTSPSEPSTAAAKLDTHNFGGVAYFFMHFKNSSYFSEMLICCLAVE